MTPTEQERIVVALEQIGAALHRLADVQAQEFRLKYPPIQAPKPATITRVKTEEELLREEQGQTGEDLEAWMTLNDSIGPREREYLRAEAARKAREAANPPAGGSERTEETAGPAEGE